MITDVHAAMIDLYQELLKSYINDQFVISTPLCKINPEETSKFKPKSQMYLGVDVMQEKKNPIIQAREDLLDFYQEKCQLFLIQACIEIKNRYEFDNPLSAKIKIFKPMKVFNNNLRDQLQLQSLTSLLAEVPRVCSKERYQSVDDEWRRLICYNFGNDLEKMKKEEIKVFRGNLKRVKNDADEYLFKDLADCVLITLTLPHSNCDSERTFSKMNRVKCKARNRMVVPTTKGLVLSSQHVR